MSFKPGHIIHATRYRGIIHIFLLLAKILRLPLIISSLFPEHIMQCKNYINNLKTGCCVKLKLLHNHWNVRSNYIKNKWSTPTYHKLQNSTFSTTKFPYKNNLSPPPPTNQTTTNLPNLRYFTNLHYYGPI